MGRSFFLQYDRKQNMSLFLATITIKNLPEVTKVIRSLIDPIIKESGCYDAQKFVARHCENGSFQIQGINFDKSYSPVAHASSFRIKIAISTIHILTAKILDVSNYLQNTSVPIHEIICVISPPYYLDWFKFFNRMFLSIKIKVHFSSMH